MMPLADLHCHLLAGLDDGPRTWSDALTMCQFACAEGTRLVAATAHQNERWGDVTPARLRAAAANLAQLLREAALPLAVFPCAEIMVYQELEADWAAGKLVSVADRGQFLLLELPHNLFVDLRPLVRRLRQAQVRPILAHPERHPELLHGAGVLEDLIRLGCLVQVSSGSVTDPASAADRRALKSWFRRGCVHLLGSDGHSPRQRPPRLADAYREIARWAGIGMADRICSTHGAAVLHGLPLRVPQPIPTRTGWLPPFWPSRA